MTLTPDMLDAMISAGLTREQIVAVTKASLAAEAAAADARRAAKRAGNAERQRRHREKQRGTDVTAVTHRNGVTERDAEQHSPTSLGNTLKTKNPPSPPTGAQTPKGVPAKRGTALPLDWKPKDRHFAKASEGGLDRDWVLGEAEGMREWAEGNSNRPIARKADWDRTFDSWLRKAVPRASRATGPPANGHHSPFPQPSNVSRRYAEPANKPRSVHDAARDLELWAADMPERGRH